MGANCTNCNVCNCNEDPAEQYHGNVVLPLIQQRIESDIERTSSERKFLQCG